MARQRSRPTPFSLGLALAGMCLALAPARAAATSPGPNGRVAQGAAPVSRSAPAAAPSAAAAPGGGRPTPAFHAPLVAAAVRPAPSHSELRVLGFLTDVGIPDGLNLGLAIRPWRWLRLHAVGGTNSASVGVRGGLTVIPYSIGPLGPSASFEVGHYRVAEFNSLVGTFFAVPSWLKDYMQRFGYTYYNVGLGMEFGSRNFTFFVRGGAAFLRGTATTPEFVYIDPAAKTDPTLRDKSARAILKQSASVRATGPSVKAGMVIMFGGP